jgi:hypothetical protein
MPLTTLAITLTLHVLFPEKPPLCAEKLPLACPLEILGSFF